MTTPVSTAPHGAPATPTHPPPSPAPLPSPEPRARRRRPYRSARHRRRRALVVVGVVASVLVAVATGLGPVRDRIGGLVPSGGRTAAVPTPGSLLLAWPTADDGGAVIVLLGGPAGSREGSALLVPGRTQVEVPSFGSQTLATTLRTAGADTLVLAVENALGYDVGDAVALDPAGLTAVLGPAAPLAVQLRRPVRLGDDVFPATRLELGGEDLARLATTRPDEASDLDHLVVIHALVEAWLAELDGDVLGLTQERLTGAAGLDDDRAAAAVTALDDLARRDVRFDTLDVMSLGVPGEERYTVDAEGAARELAALFPGQAFSEDGRRVRVEILNGTGRAGLATEAARRLVPLGAQVVLTGNATRFGVEKTVVVLQDPALEREARRLAEALGGGELRMARNPVGVADVSIVIGADFDPGGG